MDLLDWDESRHDQQDGMAPSRSDVVAALDELYTWRWWDAWPDGLSVQQQMLWQIKRDLRAAAEDQPPSREFYLERVRQYRASIPGAGTTAASGDPCPT